MKNLGLLLPALLSSCAASSTLSGETARSIQISENEQFRYSNDGRGLRVGDFDEFNELFDNASISIPDTFEVSQRVLFSDLDVKIWNIKCYGINVGDISISHQLTSPKNMEVLIDVLQLDLECEMNYSYEYSFIDGDGWLKLTTDDNSASTKINFESDDFSIKPPKGSSVSNCVANIEITNLDFEEDLLSEIVEVFQGLVRGVVERAVGNVACEELGSLGTTLVENILDLAAEKLEPYQGDLSEADTDPLFPERNLDLPTDLKALDLQDTESPIGSLVNQAFEGVDALLGTLVTDSASGSTEEDLLINMFLRSFVLDEDGSFTLDPTEMPMDSVIFEGHDRITETTITLNEVKVFGLDSLTIFDPFQKIGSYTLKNELTWRRVTVEFDVTIDIKPSTLEDAILQDPTSQGITERIVVDFGLDNVEVVASLLLLLDEEEMEALQLGPLLYTDYLLPCLLSVVHSAELSGLTFNPGKINEPTLNGFISPGVDRVISDSAEAAFAMYTGALRTSLPYIFQTSVRSFVNTDIIQTYMSDETKTSCQSVDPIPGYVDFRTFFDKEAQSHGDLPPLLKSLINAELLEIDENTGRPKINEVLIKPLTKAQSGNEGDIEFSTSVFGFNSESVSRIGMDSIEMRAFNPSIRNLDTMGAPIDILKASGDNGYLLENFVTIGASPDSVQLAMKGLFALSGDPSLDMYNEVELLVDIANSDFFAGLMAMVNSNALLTFPIRDVTNVDCWLATLATPEIGANGELAEGSDIGLALESILLTTESMRFNASCTNCTSPSLAILPQLFETLEVAGVSDVLGKSLVDLGLDVARSDFVQAYVNKRLIDSALRCPHSPSYVDALASSNYAVPTMPSLPHESLESIAFTATILLHMSMVIAAEAHAGYDLEETDPLDGQAELDQQPGLRLIDFSSFETSIGEWANEAVGQLVDYIGEQVDDPNGPGGKDLRINNLLRSTFLDESGVFDIEFNDLGIGGDDMQLSLKHVRLTGLDTVSNLNILDVIGPQTLQNVWKWKKLGVEVVFSLMSTETDAGSGRSLKSMEDITLSLEVGDIDVSLALLLALDVDLLGELKLQSLLEIGNILPCIISAAHTAKLSEFQVLAGSIKKFAISGFRSEELNSAAAESSRVMLEKYGQKIVTSMPGFFDMTIRALINNLMNYYMGDGSSIVCPSSSVDSAMSGFVDFRDLFLLSETARKLGGTGLSQYGNLFRTAFGFVQDLLLKTDDSTGLSTLNELVVAPLTESQSNTPGSLVYPGDLFNGGSRVVVGGLDANIQLRASDARVDNLDTIGSPLQLLEAVMNHPHQLNNTMTMGVNDRPVRLAVRFLLSLIGDDNMQVRNDVEISLDLYSANVILKTMMTVAESRFFGFPLRDIFDLNCWLAMIPAPTLDQYGIRNSDVEPTVSLDELAASVAGLNLNVSCIDCSSPRLPELTDLLSKAEAQEDITVAVNGLLEYITELLGGNFLQVQIDRFLNDAARQCPHSPSYEADAEEVVYEAFEAPNNELSMSFLIKLLAIAIVAILAVVAIVVAIRWIVRRRHKRWLGQLPAHQVRRLARDQNRVEKEESELNAATQSMFTSPIVPRFVRWGMPLVIIGNIVFFLSGHLSLGATVNIEAELAGEKFRVDKFFEFSMARSTVDIWNAGGKELAIIILVFSGIWPYTKQLITLALWFMPPTKLSVSRRESTLLWLDRLGKWSMIDIFVLVVSIAAFRVSVVSPDVLYLPEDFYSLDLLVVPLWGLYANMIAQVISQVSSHFIIHYHRSIVSAARVERSQRTTVASPSNAIQAQQKGTISRVSIEVGPGSNDSTSDTSPQKVRLHRHQFSRPHRGETEKLIVRSWVDKLILIGTFCLIVAVIIGCSVPSFSLEILGVIGVAVESGQNFEDATTQHSVFTVIQLLFEEAQFLGTVGDYFGLGALSMLFIFTVLLVPIIQSLALLRHWFSPATREEMKRMSVVVEMLQAWQYAEVYLIAIFVASWQLGPVSEFMINSYCDSLKETFSQLVYYGLLKEEDAQCFSVKSSIEGGSFLLAFGALLLALLSTFVTKAAAQYLRDQGEAEKRLQDEEDSPSGSDYTSRTDEDNEVDGGISAKIHTAPVLFTDSFRWLLYQENNHWDLPDNHYHWGSAASSPSRALFLPEARVLSEEPFQSTPGQYPKMKYEEAKLESGDQSIDGYSSGSSSTASFSGFRTKDPNNAGLKTTGLSQRDSFRSGCAPSRASLNGGNSYISENEFRDEASVSSASFAPSASETIARSTVAPSEYETVAEEEYEYEEEEVVPSDTLSEYEEQTVDTGFEEYTVMTEEIIEEELDDVISSYESQSFRRLD